MRHIVPGINYEKIKYYFQINKHQIVHIVEFAQTLNKNLTLLISKVSEAINPDKKGNHIGDGSNLDEFIKKQNGVRFVINGAFSHYRKNFYDWSHQNFHIGDPVGIVKIREHLYKDFLDLNHYGFFVQEEKGSDWKIIKYNDLNYNEKYILGCTPLLIYDKKLCSLPLEVNNPVKKGEINPPSYLGHGMQAHPRTAIGLKNNKIYFINIDFTYGGCSLSELQDLGLFLELDYFLNLDGGGSSQFKLIDNTSIISNEIELEERERILGHILVIFDESLKF